MAENGVASDMKSEKKSSKPPAESKLDIIAPSAYNVFSTPSVLSIEDFTSQPATTSESPKPKTRLPVGKRSKMSLILIGIPIDFSFRDAANFMDLMKMKPRSVRTRTAPRRAPSGKYLSAAIWASYNELQNIAGLKSFVSKFLEIPEGLTMLDLSFNQIRNISEEITNFPNLKVVLLHSNKIESYTDIAKLASLENLQIVTFRGNPVERSSYYRANIMNLIPQIKSLDSIVITKNERREAGAYIKMKKEIKNK